MATDPYFVDELGVPEDRPTPRNPIANSGGDVDFDISGSKRQRELIRYTEDQQREALHRLRWMVENSQTGQLAGQFRDGTGAAQTLLTQGFNRATQESLGNVASIRGLNPLMAARLLDKSQADMQSQAAQQASLLRLQELLASAELFNQLEAPLRTAFMNQYNTNMAAGQMATFQNADWGSKVLEGGAQLMSVLGTLYTGGAGAPGAAGAFSSDKRNKEKARKASREELAELAEKAPAYTYHYKPGREGGMSQGRHLGVMAQDLEKSTAGKRMVRETSSGKVIDMREAVSTLLASNAALHERLTELEKRTKKRRA